MKYAITLLLQLSKVSQCVNKFLLIVHFAPTLAGLINYKYILCINYTYMPTADRTEGCGLDLFGIQRYGLSPPEFS